ncbi:hypothetical protein MKJ01_05535 [Chryseobacterium sp. SSA4.19]|uniref:hypothetical protein n=1 Tax=Chryseobacterium sp. SSA4.19 TaxID=2919915 RepID=UPI001F4EB1D5|nr:hypothetical protein [Chryseobacterium sp. SSA4.19]MCJ8153222.1 hypothetical protein [Chryseobacterium sp. SSA4.19]
MIPINFEYTNTVFAVNQPEYQPLPAHIAINGDVSICWELTDVEIEKLKETKKLFISVKTFGQPLQPLYMSTDINDVISLQECLGCDKETDMETMTSDDDSNWFCPECWKELAPGMKADYDELVKKGEIDAR